MDGHFIRRAIRHKGALTRKAKRAGMSVYEYARAHEHDRGETGHEARFYLYVLRPINKRRKK